MSLEPQDFYEGRTEGFFSLDPLDQQTKRSEKEHAHDAFTHSRRQNPGVDGLQNFRRDQANFVGTAAQAENPQFLYVNESGHAGLYSPNWTNLWPNLSAVGALQMNRAPGYLTESLASLNPLKIPPWQNQYMIFARKLPVAIESMMREQGLNPKDFFCLYLLPERYAFAAGERLPLLPLPLPLTTLKEAGLKLSDLDFNRTKVVFPDQVVRRFQESGDFNELRKAGIHIPVKKEKAEGEIKEMFLPFGRLASLTRALHTVYLFSIGVSNPQNWEELQNTLNYLAEDLAADTTEALVEAQRINDLFSLILYGSITKPTYIPDGDRARIRNMHTHDFHSRWGRMIWSEMKHGEVRRAFGGAAGILGSTIKKTEKLLGREPKKSVEEDKEELRKAHENFRALQNEVGENLEGGGTFTLQPDTDPLESYGFDLYHEQPLEKKASLWLKGVLVGAILAPTTLAFTAMNLGDTLVQEGSRIVPYLGLATIALTGAVFGFRAHAFLRNTTIADARARDLLYSDRNPRTQRLYQQAEVAEVAEADDLEEQKQELEEEKEKEAEVQKNLIEQEKLRQRLESEKNFFKRSVIKIKLWLLEKWYNTRSLEERAESLRENPENAHHLRSIKFFGSMAISMFREVYLAALTRGIYWLYKPFYFDTRERGGVGRRLSSPDWGAWTSVEYIGVRMAAGAIDGVQSMVLSRKELAQRGKLMDRLRARRDLWIELGFFGQKAINRAAYRLELAKVLELTKENGFSQSAAQAVSVRSIDRRINQRGKRWLNRYIKLLRSHQWGEEAISEFVDYANEVYRIAQSKKIMHRALGRVRGLRRKQAGGELELRPDQIIEEVSRKVQKDIRDAMESFQVLSGSSKAYYRGPVQKVRGRLANRRLNRHDTLFRMKKTGENMTRGSSLISHGGWEWRHLEDRIMITAQLAPLIAARQWEAGMSDETFFNGLATLAFTMGPENMVGYGGALAVSSRVIDSLYYGKILSRKNNYLSGLIEAGRYLPWEKIYLQFLATLDLRVLTAINSAALTVGMLSVLDIAAGGYEVLQSVIPGGGEGQTFGEFNGKILPMLAQRVAGGAGVATIGYGYTALVSGMTYRTVMALRAGTKRMGSTQDKVTFMLVQAGLNIPYGFAMGSLHGPLTEFYIDAANIEGLALGPNPTPIIDNPMQRFSPAQLAGDSASQSLLVDPQGQPLDAEGKLSAGVQPATFDTQNGEGGVLLVPGTSGGPVGGSAGSSLAGPEVCKQVFKMLEQATEVNAVGP